MNGKQARALRKMSQAMFGKFDPAITIPIPTGVKKYPVPERIRLDYKLKHGLELPEELEVKTFTIMGCPARNAYRRMKRTRMA